ncbi:MAG: ABC transporter permease [Bacteroidota bacterium]
MLKNYLLIALRTLRRQKSYAAINVLGLALGLACFLLIAAFVQHEVTYDQVHPNLDRIHRVVQQQPGNMFMGSDRFAVTPAPLAGALVADYPEVTHATTFTYYRALLSVGQTHAYERGLWASADFFTVFEGFPLLQGNPETALAEPESVVLTEEVARTLFGDAALSDQSVLGQTVRLDGENDFTVTGIVAAPPEASTVQYTFLACILSQRYFTDDLERWNNNSWQTFFTLADGADPAALDAQMPDLLSRYLYDGSSEWNSPDTPQAERNQYEVQAMADIHLRSNVNFDIGTQGNQGMVWLFGFIGIVILLLACVNYTNLAVARAIKRAQEVGVRKAIGGKRGQIVAQFLGESVLMAALALVLALVLVHALLPMFGELVERPLSIPYTSGWLMPGLAVLVLAVGLVSGSYPALFMARLEPMQVLKGTIRGSRARPLLQRVLVVGQYAASIVLVVGSLVVFQQLRFVSQSDPGYERENVVTMRLTDWSLRDHIAAIEERWASEASVITTASVGELPTNISSSTRLDTWEGHPESLEEDMTFYQMSATHDVLDVFGLDLVAGRSFDRAIDPDTSLVLLLNETAVRDMGWTPQEAVGKWIDRGGDEPHTIIGVVEDFHQHSMHLPIAPIMIRLEPRWVSHITARVQPGDFPATIAALEAHVATFTDYPVEVGFLDAEFDALYRADQRLGQTFGFFTVIALLIASLGLFGLAAFAAEQRTKEIGIRKVLGADVLGLVRLLSLDFVKLVAVAFLVAAPIGYVAMQRWLADFAYRIELGPGLFLVAGGGALVIALAAVSVQALRAATADPVRSLRYE